MKPVMKQHLAVVATSDAAQPLASLKNITVDFDTPRGLVRALDNVSFDLMPGELLVLVGKSGSGKTTALNVLAGLVNPTGGTCEVLAMPPVQARRNIGYMFARDALMPWRTAARNVEFALEIHGIPKTERQTRAKEFLELVHLGHLAGNYPTQLSQGQRQRVALARTWAPSPKIFLMDEPFSALDAQTRENLHEEFIRMWARDRKSVVFVTHDLVEAIALADRIVVFSEGRIVRVFEVKLERPRDLVDTANDPDARAIYKEIRNILQH